MSVSIIDHSSSTTKTTQTTIEQSTKDPSNLIVTRNRSLVIILAITIPTLALIGIGVLLILFYRRRHATIWLKKFEHSDRLQTIVVNLSTTNPPPLYPEKKTRLTHRQVLQPRTETIVYNRLSTPPTPVFLNSYNHLRESIDGETNAAFDEISINHEEQQQQPVLRSTLPSSSTNGQRSTSIHADFPLSLQAPVRNITSALVEAIAAHRLSLILDENHTISSLESTTINPPTNRHSGASSSGSNTSQTVLLFSQRTEL